MKVLVIGSGGREHAICWKLSQSTKVTKLYAAPGNPGIAEIASLIDLKVDDISALLKFAKREKIDLTVVGPELPLSLGIVDAFEHEGLKIFGPSGEAAELESSKAFAKEVMISAAVPTAAYKVVRSKAEGEAILLSKDGPVVLKADGLASGKGVFVCKDSDEALSALSRLFQEFRSETVVIEECLSGVEASFIVATDGKRIVPLAAAHDYKRIRDNDEGPNTGGMGTVSPSPRLTTDQEIWTIEHVIAPVLAEMERRGTPFRGFLYAGLMITPSSGIKVLEFNARLGDPETQVILRRLESDLFELLFALSDKSGGALPEIRWSDESCVCVVLAASGYPDKPRSGDEIKGIDKANAETDIVVFHAGTGRGSSTEIVTQGGRVLNVTATGKEIETARKKVYQAIRNIKFEGVQFRNDIGVA